ncbi:MAG: Photosystem I reaction center subunit III [Pseudanabaenaceae cyanobacterium bins.68]|nr:Photosystem I reaction center subunit III [Pseudanabaenaceae cyanobacterium bins.68]
MQRFLALILVFGLWICTAPAAWADFNFDTLTPCGQNPAFEQQIQSQIDSYEGRLANFAPGSAPATYLQTKIESAKARYQKYANSSLLCGEDGLPHLISDGRLDHASEFLIPSLLFLYIAGWIGWVGRDYIRAVRGADATSKETVIDVPLALRFMLLGFAWPLAALKEWQSGELIAADAEVTVSPR